MQSVILAIDQGTTGSTVVALDSELRLLAKATQEFPQHFPQSGWVEHDPDEIWNSVLLAIRDALFQARISPQQIAGIGITNQRETTLVWDRRTGKPLYRAIVWQDRRTAHLCEALKSQGLEDEIRKQTGLVLDP